MQHENRTYSSLEEIINDKGKLIYTNVGDSMWPLIRQGKDIIVIERKPEGRLKRYDIPLYRRDSDVAQDNGKYVLHRILRVRENDYIISGDNRWNREKGISDRHIVGVLTAVVRGGAIPGNDKAKTVQASSLGFRIYSHLWCDLYPIRALICLCRDFPSWALRKLKSRRQ